MSIIVAVLSFLMGYFSEKLLDYVYRIIKQCIVRKKAKSFKTSAINIVKSGIGSPYFDCEKEITLKDTKKRLYLSAPALHEEKAHEHKLFFAEKDDSYMPLCLPGVPQEEFETVLNRCREVEFENFLMQKNGAYFNGKKFGIVYFSSLSRTSNQTEKPLLDYELFETDYYTHRILENVMYHFRDYLPTITSELVNSRDFPLFRTSLGVSVIVIIPKSNQIIVTKRSKNSSYSDNIEWYYVSVTESLSEVDYDEYLNQPSIVNCVKKGLIEELYLKPNFYNENTIKIYDTFYETYFFQDGLVISIELNPDVDISNVEFTKAKDNILEVASVELIDNSAKAIRSFISKNRDKMRAQTIFALESYAARL